MRGVRKIVSGGAAWVLGLMAAAVSCTERIDIDTGDDLEKLVIHYAQSDIEPVDPTLRSFIWLDYSTDYFNTDYHNQRVTGATVNIYSSNGGIYRFEATDAAGYYRYKDGYLSVEPGEELTLEVSIPEGENPVSGYLTVSETVPHPATVDSVTITPSKVMGVNMYNVNASFQDPPGADNYYFFLLTITDSLGNRKYPQGDNPALTSYILLDDRGSDGDYFDGVLLNTYISTVHNTGNSPGTVYLAPGDEVTVRMCTVTKGYYDFIDQCQSVKNGTNPFFGGPPSNIISNIPGGVGYFTGYCHTSASAVVPELNGGGA